MSYSLTLRTPVKLTVPADCAEACWISSYLWASSSASSLMGT